MRTWLLALALVGCGNPSKLDGVASSPCDALWDLAPAGTEVGIVASPRGLQLAFDAFAAARQLVTTPDFAGLAPQLDAVTTALFGAPAATPADSGFAAEQGFAMFVVKGGVIAVLPVVDRDKFVTAKRGTRAGAAAGSGGALGSGGLAGDADDLGGSSCKPLRGHYVCATAPALFDRLGTGSLRGKAKLAGGRGDLELYAPQLPLFGGTAGDAAIVAELDRGELAVRGVWKGTPGGGLGKLVGVRAPRIDAGMASGFAAGNVSALLAGLPPFPVAGGITLDQLAKSFTGPVSAVTPSGSYDLQVHVPLNDPAPAQTALDHCADLGELLTLSTDQPKDACRFRFQASSSSLELDTWVDPAARELRMGAHRTKPSPGAPGALTPIGRELATGDWTAVLWGRGAALNFAGLAPTVAPSPEAVAAAHAVALVNELGGGLRVEPTGVTIRGVLRTAWANPPDLVAKLLAISGDDIALGKATATGQALATAAPGSRFAGDFAAGEGGLILTSAMLGLAAAVAIPALEAALGAGAGDDDSDDADSLLQ